MLSVHSLEYLFLKTGWTEEEQKAKEKKNMTGKVHFCSRKKRRFIARIVIKI